MDDKIKELRLYVDERLLAIDEAVRLLFLNSIARDLETELNKQQTRKLSVHRENKAFECELNVEVIHKPEEKNISDMLKPLGVKLKSIECLQKQELAMLTCKNNWKIAEVRRIGDLFKEHFTNTIPVFCTTEMTVATKRLMIKENFNYVIKNKEFRIISGR